MIQTVCFTYIKEETVRAKKYCSIIIFSLFAHNLLAECSEIDQSTLSCIAEKQNSLQNLFNDFFSLCMLLQRHIKLLEEISCQQNIVIDMLNGTIKSLTQQIEKTEYLLQEKMSIAQGITDEALNQALDNCAAVQSITKLLCTITDEIQNNSTFLKKMSETICCQSLPMKGDEDLLQSPDR